MKKLELPFCMWSKRFCRWCYVLRVLTFMLVDYCAKHSSDIIHVIHPHTIIICTDAITIIACFVVYLFIQRLVDVYCLFRVYHLRLLLLGKEKICTHMSMYLKHTAKYRMIYISCFQNKAPYIIFWLTVYDDVHC